MPFISAVNQPERVHINSSDDPSDTGIFELWPYQNEKFFDFMAKFKTAILAPERSQLLRATIPNIVLNLPDYQLCFWYSRIPQGSTDFTQMTYHNVRILPSWFSPTDAWAVSTGLPINRQLINYQDFVQVLNQAAAATDDNIRNPYHIPGDIQFYYDPITRLISVEPQDVANYEYYLLGYNNPLLDTLNKDVLLYDLGTGIPTRQPSVSQLDLNLRVGFCGGGVSLNFIQGGQIVRYPGFVEPNSTNNTFIANTFGDLVYSQNVYLLANYAQGSSLGSGGQHNIIATIPIAAPPLGVASFSAPLVNWLTKISKEIFEIKLTMLDDNYQPFLLPNSAIVSVELGFSYIPL